MQHLDRCETAADFTIATRAALTWEAAADARLQIPFPWVRFGTVNAEMTFV
jgi:hypothetical protein